MMPKKNRILNKKRAGNVLLLSMLIIGSYFFAVFGLICDTRKFDGSVHSSTSVSMNGAYETAELQGERTEATLKESEIREPEGLYAQSAVLLDAESGNVLFEKNGTQARPMASTTKIMTCILALENGNLDEVVTASALAAGQPKVHLGVVEGEQIILRDLLYSLMLESHNDAAVMIAEQIGGSVEGFADMMNQKAGNIGCQNTYFITPNGLDASDESGIHRTTAEDLAKIMKYCIQDSSQAKQFLSICQTKTYQFEDCSHVYKYACYNHNAFLGMMDGAIAGKTGFTNEAGYCYVGALERGGKKLIVALLACGWPNHKAYKWSDTRVLMNYGLNSFMYAEFPYEQVKSEIERTQVPVVNGIPKDGKLSGISCADICLRGIEKEEKTDNKEGILIRKDKKIEVKISIKKQLYAPVAAGSEVGEVQYLLENVPVKRQKIVVKEQIGVRNYRWCFWKMWENYLL